MTQCKPQLWWIKHFTAITFDPEGPCIVLSLTPVFPGCAADLAQEGIVWDLQALIASVSPPGSHDVLNCECGYPPDAYLQAPVAVSHPDDQTVIWEMDRDMESAHAHGERFARALAQPFAEGATAPGARVVYVQSDIPG